MRNDVFDAVNYFNPDKTPLKQNQFGGAIGGPVVLPHYNGRNKTFFYFSYEGFRNHTAANNLFLTPTPAQLGGDFSNLDSQGTQLFNPYSSVPDPNSATGFDRQPFMCDGTGAALPANASGTQPAGTPCNVIPTSLLNSTMVLYAKTLFPAHRVSGIRVVASAPPKDRPTPTRPRWQVKGTEEESTFESKPC